MSDEKSYNARNFFYYKSGDGCKKKSFAVTSARLMKNCQNPMKQLNVNRKIKVEWNVTNLLGLLKVVASTKELATVVCNRGLAGSSLSASENCSASTSCTQYKHSKGWKSINTSYPLNLRFITQNYKVGIGNPTSES